MLFQELSAAYGSQLTRLTLQDCDIDDSLLEFIVDNFTQLNYLDISNNNSIRNGQSLSRIGKNIKVIKIGPDVSNEESNPRNEISLNSLSLGNGIHIEELHLNSILNSQFRFLSRFGRLKVLVINFFKGTLDLDLIDYFSPISQLKSLEHLELHQIHCYDNMMAINLNQLTSIIANCRNLKHLSITSNYWCESFFSNLTFKVIAESLSKLEYLKLIPGNCLINDHGINNLVKLNHLKTLSLTSYSSITDSGLVNLLLNCNQLVNLEIEDCYDITSNFIHILIANKFPRKLNLSFKDTRVKQRDLPAIIPCNVQIKVLNEYYDDDITSQGIGFKSIVNSIISFTTFLTTALAISMYLVHQFLCDNLSSFTLLLVTTMTIFPVGYFLYQIHNLISNMIFASCFLFHFNFNFNPNINQRYDDNEQVDDRKWNYFDRIFDWLIDQMTS